MNIDHTYKIKKKNEKIYYVVQRVMRKLKRLNPDKGAREIQDILYDTFLETVTEWLIWDKQPFSAFKNHFILQMINADGFPNMKYNIKRRGNQPMLYIRLSGKLWWKRKINYAVLFHGKAYFEFLRARRQFEEYITLKESKYVNWCPKHDVHNSQGDHEQAENVNKEQADL